MEGYLGIMSAGTTFGDGGGMVRLTSVRAPTEGCVRHRARASNVYGKRCPVTSGKQPCLNLCIVMRTLLILILYVYAVEARGPQIFRVFLSPRPLIFVEHKGYPGTIYGRAKNAHLVPVFFLCVYVGFQNLRYSSSAKVFVERRHSPVGRS